MTLYEINNAVMQAFNDAVDPETGEIIDEEKLNELDDLQMEMNQKIENIGLWIKNLDAEEKALDAEEKSFKKRKDAAHSKKESLKNYLKVILDGNKFKSEDGKLSVSFRKSQAVNIKDMDDLPLMYLEQKLTPKKEAIKKALKDGEEVPGAELVTNQSIVIK